MGDRSGPESRLSRRALFGTGLGRLVRHRLEGLERLGDELPCEGRPERRSAFDRSRLKEEIRREWGDGDPRPLLGRLEAAAEVLARAAGSGTGQHVLDVGAGDGNLALALARRGAAVVAADLSPAMVERGRARTAEAGHEVEWHEADVEALPFYDDRFDAVLSSFGAIWASQPGQMVAELTRVCRPGGLIGMAAWSPSGFMGRVIALARSATDWPRDVPPPERWGRYETAYLHLFGLDDLEVFDESMRLEFADTEELWSILSAPPGPLAGALRRAADCENDLRREALALAEHHGSEANGRLQVQSAYALMLGRRPEWADGPRHA